MRCLTHMYGKRGLVQIWTYLGIFGQNYEYLGRFGQARGNLCRSRLKEKLIMAGKFEKL